MVNVLEKFTIWLENGKVGYHEHDGYPEHPVAVKHHPEYFSEHGEKKIPSKQPEFHPVTPAFLPILEENKDFLQWAVTGELTDFKTVTGDNPMFLYFRNADTDETIAFDSGANKWWYQTSQGSWYNLADVPKKNWKEDLYQIDSQKGSMPGGVYRDHATGKEYYVKHLDPDHAEIENLAGKLYALAGVPIASTELVDMGKEGRKSIKSSMIEDARHISDPEELWSHPEVVSLFPVDAWLANWDVAGMDLDNIIIGTDGKAYRIDLGGSLTKRAQGKDKTFGTSVPELESMLDPNLSPQAAKVFAKVKEFPELMAPGAERLSQITDAQIKDVVSSTGLSASQKENLFDTLVARRDFIVSKILKKPSQEACPPGFHKHGVVPRHSLKEYQVCHPENQRHRGIKKEEDRTRGKREIIDVLMKHKNPRVREITNKALEAGLNTVERVNEFLAANELRKEGRAMDDNIKDWKENPQRVAGIQLRAALQELLQTADQQYATENAYFVHVAKIAPSKFDRAYADGRYTALALIPFIVLSQNVLRQKFPKGHFHAFRAVGGNLAESLKSAVSSMDQEDVVAIPNDGMSGFSLDRGETVKFGSVTLTKRDVPVSKALIYFPAITYRFREEQEILLDSDATTLFYKDEIEVR